MKDTGAPTTDGCASTPAPIRVNALAAIQSACLLRLSSSAGLPGPSDPCDDDDVCTSDQCSGTMCTNDDVIFGDVNNDGAADVFDILCLLDGFADVFNSPCTMTNLDISPCPGGDGAMDVFDILAVLDAFADINVCNCPAGP